MKKVLIISYYWPPAGGPVVQRVLKFAKWLPEFGWQPIILTVKEGDYPAIDKKLTHQVAHGIKVYKTRSIEPFCLYKKFTGKKSLPTFVMNKDPEEKFYEKSARWIRANFFIPDARIGWLPYLVKEGLRIIEKENPQLIFSTSPPHSLQLGAMKLARKTGLKWVADFRDPWGGAFWQRDIRRMIFARRIDENQQKRVLVQTQAVITVSPSLRSLLIKNSGLPDHYLNKISVIANGYDEDDFSIAKPVGRDKFIITYAGSLGRDQRIDNFLTAFQEIEEELKRNVEIHFFGSIHASIKAKLEQRHLKDYVKMHPFVSHDEIINYLCGSDMLLLVIPDCPDNKGILTGKIFEYLRAGGFILGIGPVEGDAAGILESTGSGRMFGYNDNLKDILQEKIKKGKYISAFHKNESAISKFTRRKLTNDLADLFEEVL